ncbi:MAG TPA: CRISPR-associated protein Cas4 [Epulopiscium sp.]|nr:CRISPR-associated protein Cas4 [Candidatus Epulonipiscium sp.]
MEPVIIYILVAITTIYLASKLMRPAIAIKQPRHGIPGAQIIYSDEEDNTLLVSEKYDLQGKPDYIFQTLLGGSYIPVELKSTKLKQDEYYPHEGDLMQLVAYFLIIEDVYGKRPKQGRLIYKNKMFIIKNTGSLRRQIKRHLKEMRRMIKTGKGTALPSFPKCRNCVCRGTVCEWYQE